VNSSGDPDQIYIAHESLNDDRRTAKHRLVQETRRLVEEVALVDTRTGDVDLLQSLAEDVNTLAVRVGTVPSLRADGGLALADSGDSVLTERSPISGRSNPLASPLHLEVREGVTYGWAIWTDAYEGPPGCLHGGFVAAAFDDLMGLAQLASGKAGYTGTLTVRMLSPTPLNSRIDYEAHLERVDDRKIWCSGTSRLGDKALASAEVLFIAPRLAESDS
jgi:hypothetical protein